MALAFNGYPRVDVESLLFDIKDILRTSLQVNKAQNAEIARLGGKPINDLMAAEYDERVNLALTQVDAALDVFDSESFEAASTHYEFDIAAWIHNTNKSLGLQFESEPTASDAVDFTSDVVTASAPMDSLPPLSFVSQPPRRSQMTSGTSTPSSGTRSPCPTSTLAATPITSIPLNKKKRLLTAKTMMCSPPMVLCPKSRSQRCGSTAPTATARLTLRAPATATLTTAPLCTIPRTLLLLPSYPTVDATRWSAASSPPSCPTLPPLPSSAKEKCKLYSPPPILLRSRPLRAPSDSFAPLVHQTSVPSVALTTFSLRRTSRCSSPPFDHCALAATVQPQCFIYDPAPARALGLYYALPSLFIFFYLRMSHSRPLFKRFACTLWFWFSLPGPNPNTLLTHQRKKPNICASDAALSIICCTTT